MPRPSRLAYREHQVCVRKRAGGEGQAAGGCVLHGRAWCVAPGLSAMVFRVMYSRPSGPWVGACENHRAVARASDCRAAARPELPAEEAAGSAFTAVAAAAVEAVLRQSCTRLESREACRGLSIAAKCTIA